MSFHPDQNLPGCMMPDGGECCAGHAAVCEDWHKQRREIERLRSALLQIEQETIDHFAVGIARKALSITSGNRGGK